jgi:hypothetical protein
MLEGVDLDAGAHEEEAEKKFVGNTVVSKESHAHEFGDGSRGRRERWKHGSAAGGG